MVIVSVLVSKIISPFQDFSYGIFYFSVDQMFIDFKVFTCLSDREKVRMENERVST